MLLLNRASEHFLCDLKIIKGNDRESNKFNNWMPLLRIKMRIEFDFLLLPFERNWNDLEEFLRRFSHNDRKYVFLSPPLAHISASHMKCNKECRSHLVHDNFHRSRCEKVHGLRDGFSLTMAFLSEIYENFSPLLVSMKMEEFERRDQCDKNLRVLRSLWSEHIVKLGDN